VVAVPLRADILDNDLTLVYVGIRIAFEHGWSHVYSLPLQHELFAQLRPHAVFNDGERFLSPPPYAWLILPLTVAGPAAAVYAWLALSFGAVVAAWQLAAPGSGTTRGLWLLGAIAWYPLLYALSLAQPDLAVILIVAAAWRLAESRRDYLAGAVLGLAAIKPQLSLLVPVVLVFAGRWRIAAGWVAVACLLAAASLAAIGGQGLRDYLALLSEAQSVTNNRYFTFAYLVGPGAASYVAQALAVVAAAALAYRNRAATPARLFALGLVATALGATYWHLQDFAVLVAAAWLYFREPAPGWQRGLAVAIAIAGEFAWPLTPLPILVLLTAWLACFALKRRSPLPAAA
jgi:Glycosyltransferase family 87